jgi:hypothetical protein
VTAKGQVMAAMKFLVDKGWALNQLGNCNHLHNGLVNSISIY